ncbi:ABC transporter ATP-binding protein [Methanolobus mangrovi]|uniref:ABC transporter ATP-binding protein n=1 Tax=Methanolobus mangrovi TaxID=3072977 RepID=A0AA51YHJ7_9EURY|nr:ABC transporter ATP-binding protein [Methanolobus mangrovi]WMW23236.1 ABC transporter ATP-binding protein [Methanolobus mangrovi]
MVASSKKEPIIEVKGLSKQYSIGMDKTYKTLSDSLTCAVRHPLMTLKNSFRTNNAFWALKDVNFEVERGDVVGIIGRNGAGKSTLLKVLSRITYPTEGEIKMRGRVGSLLEVGTGFHPELTGRENIYFNGSILGMKKKEIDEKFDEIVKFSGVEKFLDTPVKRYSSGMNVRLGFSVAAHLDPEILIVDEVLAVGDAAFQKKCLGKMEEVAEGGRTVLFVSHNMGAVNNLCSKAIWLQSGLIRQIGDTHDIVTKYINEGNEGEGFKVWDCLNNSPGDDTIKLIHVAIKNEFDKIISCTDISSSFVIEIKYVLLKKATTTKIGVTLFADDGTCVFTSNDIDFLDSSNKESEGIYITQCFIPGNLLNNGFYYVRISSTIPMKKVHFAEDNILKLEIEALNGVGTHNPEPRRGVIRPLLNWSIKKIGGYMENPCENL